ncbi:MAG: hypothetical protein KAJ34_00750 [Thermodesulfovibrionia bacterium]|nr:hypothetical protein [Thermodesulfovibrionia bacterium]
MQFIIIFLFVILAMLFMGMCLHFSRYKKRKCSCHSAGLAISKKNVACSQDFGTCSVMEGEGRENSILFPENV